MFRKNLKSSVKTIQCTNRLMSTDLKDVKTILSVQYCKFGEPEKVLQLMECCSKTPESSKVLVKVLAAPITKVDDITILGKHPLKPKLPAVAGHECVGEVIALGDQVKNLKVGDRVIPAAAGLGTWTTMGLWDEKDLVPISNKLGLVEAATLGGDPCVAYRILRDFVKLKPGDTVIQNGAHTNVGRMVHQLCKRKHITTVGIVGPVPNLPEVYIDLKCLGATEVITEEEFMNCDIFKSGKIKKPKLALNCIGGKTTIKLAAQLEPRGAMVTYDGTPKQPVMSGMGPLIYNDISVRGFCIKRWNKRHNGKPEQKEMLTKLTELIEKGEIMPPDHELIPLSKFEEGAYKALCPHAEASEDKLLILTMT